ncbi:transcription termination factor MTERF8, chloroplastic [Ricinus communis]|uniref:transcription termination factor MTERF8, chloroplastic n=1 Tax=Ricinus communis TaxID=3988 RepID=UPI00201AECF6|nr:transcription termination factor MTERF8, chloroplastic [Ricinus communis]
MSSFSYSSTSFVTQTLIPSPTKFQFSFISLPIIIDHHHQRWTLSNLGNNLRPSGDFPVHCNYLDSPNQQNATRFLYSFFREFGLNEKETEFILEQNPSLTLTAFDSIRSRVFLLESVGLKGAELYRLIIKCPDVLTAEQIHPFLHFVLNNLQGRIEPAQIKRLFSASEPRFLVGFDQKVTMLLSHGVPEEKIGHILNNINLLKAMCLKSVKEIDRTISFLSRFGGIDIIVRRPMILNFDLDRQLIPRVEFLKEISGGDEEATGTLLRKLPAILSYSLEHIKGHVELLRSFGGLTDPQIFKIFLVFPNVISASKERKLRPRIEFLKQCGLNSDEIFKFLTKAPLFLGLSFEYNLVHKIVFLVKIGYGYRNKELTVALGAVTRTSCDNLQKVIELFFSYGFSSPDILSMSKKHPQILQYSYSSLQEKMEYLIEGMGREVGELLAFPAFLGYKLDDRIKHRYEVKRKVIGEGMSLNKLLSVSADRFSVEKKKKSYSRLTD